MLGGGETQFSSEFSKEMTELVNKEMVEIGRSIASSLHYHKSSFQSLPSVDSMREKEDDEVELQWAAIERMDDAERPEISHCNGVNGNEETSTKVIGNIRRFGALERRMFIESLIKNIEEDNRRLLKKVKERIDKVGVKFPTVEVRYKDLSVEAKCEVVHGKPLPTLWNSTKAMLSGLGRVCGIKTQQAKLSIIKDASGIIKPSRMTLLLGPPGCGKTTLLLALAGKVAQPLKVRGDITYNGFELNEFVPEKTSAYISQHDLHIPQMTVRETVDFSARCQGVGCRQDIMLEVKRREKLAGTIPESDVDAYMEAISEKRSDGKLQTEYILKILGLDSCADIIVGDAAKRGISGGEKKRLTTGEVIVGPTRALFMDEISTGLDSSTTFQIVSCLQQLVHITEVTAVVSLLQPAPETFNLFDDIILMTEGRIIYHGPRSLVLQFFEDCGLKCPERKGIADFLQEVISRKDQAQYWYHNDLPYQYVTADQFSQKFKECNLGKQLNEELSVPLDRSQSKREALSFSIYSLAKWELFKACMARELLLMKRDSFVHVFKTAQLVIVAIITMTIFLRTYMRVDPEHANYFMGVMFYTLMRLATNGIAELTLTVSRLPVFYKQKDLNFYPAWAYSIPTCILKIPFSLMESFLWTALTYYVIGFSPEAKRFFYQFLILFGLHQMSTSLFRLIAAVMKTPILALFTGNLAMFMFCAFCGFILPRTSMPSWMEWGFWITPISYAEIGIAINEFHAPRWQKVLSQNMTLGQQILSRHGLNFREYYYWISLGALFGFTLIFNFGFTLALTYLKSPGKSKSIISHQQLPQGGETTSNGKQHCDNSTETATAIKGLLAFTAGVALPFKPLAVAFQDVQYFVNTPQEMRDKGITQKKLQLLCDITGAFRPGILTALMGVSGAGKTTLMDVLSGRKTGGDIQGEIRIGGHPKVQETFARISGYCEQNDIHSPNITVKESIIFSAWLRLAPEIDQSTKSEFVEEVLQTIELDNIKDALVGVPGVSGLSTEQRKRLTIAVELVSNPSVIFMDEPTSGLDARAAAIVMRAVKNVTNTGRTVVCTIHQPSIDIFESFDELILMKRGGQIIYSGPIGRHSSKLIEYFEAIPGVAKIKPNYNPATWMMEATTNSVEKQLHIDFANVYKKSTLYCENKELVKQLSQPPAGSTDLQFPSRFAQKKWVQYKACLWKQHNSYWRSPAYNLLRFMFTVISAIMFGAGYWQHGKKISNEQDLFNMGGSLFLALLFIGLNNCITVVPIVSMERNALYREKFAGMYSSWAYSFAQITIETPYVLLQSALYVIITYPLMGYYWSAYKFFWYFYVAFSSFLCSTFLGMLLTSLSPNTEIASILSAASYTLLNLFSGFLIPRPKIPKWWIWLYWVCPTSWALNGYLSSQYGNITKQIKIYGESKAINAFVRDFYGFHHDQLGLVAFMLLFFPLVFALLFAYCIGKLNFQRR